ncbi:MAG TPA: DUF4349 domain-containing protein [Candidatus Gemmiger excrementavium]|uniref:DUF4349 domain-containing protein n=1 Tax=Candidatus Gemmiger excrementavium TaxID=2838608 RepID=A0A9D2F4B8_9FIRM|nr:DUF4349 domain-containing protein [Candidatus Gemmiger excrementavium]
MKRTSLLLAALLTATLLAGCGANSGGSASATATYDMSVTEEASMGSGGGESNLMPENAATGETAQQKIIYRADMSIESTLFDTARETVLAAVEDTGSWMEYSHQNGTAEDRDRYANFTVRVPADNYRTFLEQVGQAGSVLSLNESAENVTSTYIDMEARISSLENQRDRLNELAAEAETTTDLLEIESRLSDVQYELESYTQQLRNLDGQVSYSTVDITLREVATLTPTGVTFPERLADAFAGGWHGFVTFVQGLVLTLVYLWPLLLVAVILLVILLPVMRRRKAARAERRADRASSAPYPYSQPSAPQDSPAEANKGEEKAEEPKPKY